MEPQLRAALLDWLRADEGPLAALNAIEEEVPARSAPPWLAVVASASVDWSTKDQLGREIRLALELHSRADDPRDDAPLVSALDRRIEALPREQDGFDVASVQFLRARTERRANNARATLLEYRFRCLAAQPE